MIQLKKLVIIEGMPLTPIKISPMGQFTHSYGCLWLWLSSKLWVSEQGLMYAKLKLLSGGYAL